MAGQYITPPPHLKPAHGATVANNSIKRSRCAGFNIASLTTSHAATKSAPRGFKTPNLRAEGFNIRPPPTNKTTQQNEDFFI